MRMTTCSSPERERESEREKHAEAREVEGGIESVRQRVRETKKGRNTGREGEIEAM